MNDNQRQFGWGLPLLASLALWAAILLAGGAALAQSSVLPGYQVCSTASGSTVCSFQPVDATHGLPVSVITGGGGVSAVDQSIWAQGVTALAPTGCTFSDASTLSVNTEGTVRCTTKRAFVVDVDTTGNALYTALTASIPAGTNNIGSVNLGTLNGAATATNQTNGTQQTQLSLSTITGSVSAKTITSSSAQVLAAATRQLLAISNESTTATIACAFGATAAINTAGSFTLIPGQTRIWNSYPVPADIFNCISSAATSAATVEAN